MRNKPHFPLLPQRCQQQHSLHPGKRLADALAESRSEGKVSELCSPGLGLGRKALWIETQRIRKETRIPMRDELAHQNRGPGWQEKFAQLKIIERVSPHGPRRRIQPHRFRHHHFHVAQPGNVFIGWQAPLQLPVDLLVEAKLALRILREQIPGPGQCIGHGLISSEEDGDHLITKRLLRREAPVRRGGQHQVQQTSSVRMMLAVRLNHAVRDGVDPFAGAHKRRQSRRTHVHQPLCRRQHYEEVIKSHDAVDGISKFVNFATEVSRE